MTKEEFEKYILEENKEVYLESERLTYYNFEGKIFVFKENKFGNGITLGQLNTEIELPYEKMVLKNV